MKNKTIIYLEMLSPDSLQPVRLNDSRFRIESDSIPRWEFNRFLYLTVGADWHWNDKRVWTDDQWRQYVESSSLKTFVAYYDDEPAGFYELHCDHETGDVEIAYFGLLPAFIGRGLGGALLTSAIEQAWSLGTRRVWVHTCNFDHPAALKNYQSRGMKVYKSEESMCENV